MFYLFKGALRSRPEQQKHESFNCLGYMRDEILPRYVEIIISHCKDPY